ncbi:MAG: heavy metal translocating P-type ATPase, partial [Clostridia bacterium]
TSVDMSALSGESLPKDLDIDSQILSGSINLSGVITVSVTKTAGESTVSKILSLVENATVLKSKSEKFITKFAKYYTPAVFAAAILIALLPPLLIDGATFSDWIYRSLAFLVVSCPCALVISVPMSFFGGIGRASKEGILIKGGNYLEALALAEVVVFDKTGTLTKGTFKVRGVFPAEGVDEIELLKAAAYAESYSNHPIAASIKHTYPFEIDSSLIDDVKEMAGFGVSAMVEGARVYVGNAELIKNAGASPSLPPLLGTAVYVARENEYLGCVLIADEIKEDAVYAVEQLKNQGIKKMVMLSGDTRTIAEETASDIGISEVYAPLLPAEKLAKVEELLKTKTAKGKLVFAGDGINDAPSLARADIGVAMGALGSDAAIDIADIVIMTDEPSKIARAIGISRKTLTIAWQNIIFAIGVKVAVLILSAFGIASMWMAVFADVGVACLAVLNAFRALAR